MKKMYLVFIVFGLIGFTSINLYSQSGIVVTGGNSSSSSGSISYSAGQVNYVTTKANSGTISPGVQQAYEIFVVTGIEETGIKLLANNVHVYPNPASTFLTLNIENYKHENISYQLFDIQGKIIIDKKADGINIQISVTDLTNGTYFVKVLNNNTPVKTFKIIKTQ